MHAPECYLHPGDLSFRAEPPGLGPTDHARRDPWAPLVESWQRLYTFFQTVAAGATELANSELIHGPFRLDWIMATVTAQNIPNIQLTLGVDYNDATSGVNFDIAGRPNPTGFGDNGTNPTTAVVTLTPVLVPVGVIHRQEITRLVYACRNATGGSVSIFGQVHITHLTARNPGPYIPE